MKCRGFFVEKILTIVVPSYNTEKYIDECLPTMLHVAEIDLLEILLIDDGSVDGTLDKLLEYEKEYKESVRVIHKENGGHGSVINCGIREAKGKYFKVIDGDDWVNTSNLNSLLQLLKIQTVDLVISPYQTLNEVSKKEKIVNYNVPACQVVDFNSVANHMDKIALHSITYNTNVLKKNNIRVREKCFYEDTEYVLYPLLHIQSAIYYDFPVYIYRVGSATQSVNAKQAFKNRKMHEMIVKDCVEYYDKYVDEMHPEIRNLYCRIITSKVNTQYNIFLKNAISKEEAQEIVDWDLKLKNMSEFYYEMSNKSYISFLRKNIKLNSKIIHFLYSIIMGLKRY